MYYYEIYVEDQKGSFTYKSETKYEIGEWCIINFINRNKAGLVLFEVSEDKITFDLSKLKPIISKAPILSIPNPIMNLIDWMAKYYLSDYYHVIKTAYPGALKLTYSKKAIYLEDLEEKLKQHPKLFIFCNPHNPLGHVWSREELKAIGDLCIKYNVPVISDEIHADLTLWGNQHIPMASVSEEIRQNTITCTATGKAFNLAGLQSATIVFNNIENKTRFDRFWKDLEVHRNNPFNLVATIAAYTEGEDYLIQLINYLEKNILFLNDFMKKNIPLIKPNVPQATYLVWLDCRELMKKYNLNQDELEKFIYQKAKIGLNSCRAFNHGSSGFMRINTACPRSVLERALKQLETACNELENK